MPRRLALAALFISFAAVQRAGDKSQWIELTSPNFIVVSNAGQREAQKTAIELEQIRATFRQSSLISSEHESPVITVLALRDENTFRDLLPDYWEKGRAHPTGIFVSNLNKHYIALRTDLASPGARDTIYHEYFHSITAPYSPLMPTWLSEGLAEVFGRAEVHGRVAVLGISERAKVERLHSATLIPLDVLFRVDANSPFYSEQDRASLFYAESWGIAHYLVIGDGGAHRGLLRNYLAALDANMEPIAAARNAFGDLEKFQQNIAGYLSSGTFSTLTMTALPETGERDFRVRAISGAEAEAIRGDFEVCRNSFEIAQSMIAEAAKTDPTLALPHESLAFMEYLQHRPAEALAEISKAIELDTGDYLAFYFRSFLTVSERPAGILDPRIESDLRRSIAINPNFAPAYGDLALYLALHEKNLEEALGFAEKAAGMEPGTSAFQFDLGSAFAALHRYEEAMSAAKRGLALARLGGERTRAEQFIADIRKASASELALESVGHEDAESGDGEADARAAGPESGSVDHTSVVATGRIAAVVCSSGGLTLALEADGKRIELSRGDKSLVQFGLHADAATSFDVCSQLQGHRAKVSYLPAEDGRFAGLLLRVELLD